MNEFFFVLFKKKCIFAVLNMKRKNYIYIIILLISLLLPVHVTGQRIVSIDVDTVACMNDSVRIGIGYRGSNEVVVRNGETTLSRPGRAFLPDGVPCGTMGCSYRSAVTFTDFAPNAHISSVQDIKYVRLNIEHSYIGDIYIGINCPNGQSVSLMNWSGTGSSSCDDEVPTGRRSWNTGNNVSLTTYLGQAYDYTDYGNKCDSNRSDNHPGVGWNYCWSNNTTSGYSYASGDGIIYRSGHSHGGIVDSSNVAAGTNFYKPNQNFSGLVGCPLNGQWYIEVIDAYSGDNGWIFDWELSLNPNLLPEEGVVTERVVYGDRVTAVNDSTYFVSAPEGAGNDTTVPYTVHIVGSGGDTIDSVVYVHYYPLYYTVVNDTLCSGDTARWQTFSYTSDTSFVVHLTGENGCDSVVEVNYTFRPPVRTFTFDTLCMGDTVLHARTVLTSDTLVIDSLRTDCGCDSLVERLFVFNPVYDTVDSLQYCRGSEFLYEGLDYGGPMTFDSPHRSVSGCDSMVHVNLSMIDSAFLLRLLISGDGEAWSEDTVITGCQPTEVWLADSTELEVWRMWLTGDGDTLTEAEASHLYDTTGVFDITLIAGSVNGCVDSITKKSTVWVYPNPTAAFDWEIKIPAIHDAQTQFKNLSEPRGLDFLWEIETYGGGTDTSTKFEPHYRWGEPHENTAGDYRVQLVAYWTHLGPDTLTTVCTDTVSDTVTIVNDFLEFPSMVTPNGDGENDYWGVVNLLEAGVYSLNELWIYDRWGVLVYHVRNIYREEDFWDPNKTHAPDGTYYYRFAAMSSYGVVKRNGTIEVMRGE